MAPLFCCQQSPRFSPHCANILDKQGISPYDNPSQEHTGKQEVKTEVKSFGLFFHAFLSFFDVNALCGIVDSSATQIVDDCGGIVGGNGMDIRNLIYSHCSMSKRPINIGKVKL